MKQAMECRAVPADPAPAPDLAELCRIYDVGIELIERSHDVDDLIGRVLDEYEARLADLPADAFGADGASSAETARKVRALVMFAGQAAALKEKAIAAAQLRERALALEAANARLEGVLAALGAGILIVDRDGSVLQANVAASTLAGEGAVLGHRAPDFVLCVEPGHEHEVVVEDAEGRRDLLVTRRALEGGVTVALLSDVTSHVAHAEERHRLDKLAEILRTLGILSHKINNPLTALLGRAQLLRTQGDVSPQVARAAEVIEQSSLRIAELIRELGLVVKNGRQEAVDRVLDTGRVLPPGAGGRP